MVTSGCTDMQVHTWSREVRDLFPNPHHLYPTLYRTGVSADADADDACKEAFVAILAFQDGLA